MPTRRRIPVNRNATARLSLVLAVLFYASAASAAEVTNIVIYPPEAKLNTKLARQGFIVLATRDDGVTLDITKSVSATVANGAFVRLDGTTLYPIADGETTLDIEYA